MQFCKDCGTVLNLFGASERDLCSSCVQLQKKAERAAACRVIPADTQEDRDEALAGAVLCCEHGKLVLRAKEGWELWSGSSDQRWELQSILDQAGRIYQIRLRRQKN